MRLFVGLRSTRRFEAGQPRSPTQPRGCCRTRWWFAGSSRKPAPHTVVPRRVGRASRVPQCWPLSSKGFPFPSFSLGLGGLGAFPSSGIPRVVWLGVGTGLIRSRTSTARLQRGFSRLGLPPSVARSQPTLRSGESSPLAPASALAISDKRVERRPGKRRASAGFGRSRCSAAGFRRAGPLTNR